MVRKVVSLPPAMVTRPVPGSRSRCRRDTLDALPSLPPATDAQASGIAVAAPVRWRTLLRVLRSAEARVVLARDAALPDAVRQLGAMGLAVEPTSAVVLDALHRLDAESETTTVLLLTAAARRLE